MRRTPFGHRQGTTVGGIAGAGGVWTPTSDDYANVTALGNIGNPAVNPNASVSDRTDGDYYDLAGGATYQYLAASAAVDPTNQLVVTPFDGVGAFVRIPGSVDLAFPVGFATANATVLFTVPVNARMLLRRGYWAEITTAFTGGAASAIGASSSRYAAAGSLQGGAAGDLAASLVAAPGYGSEGTVGSSVAAGALLVGGDTILFNAITSAFTAGAGNLHLVFDLLSNPGM